MASPGLYTTDPERDMTAELERRVVEVNKAFAGWVMASWEMCPTHEWTGAAQEYCNKITKLAKEYSSSERGGTDLHLSSASNAAGSRQAVSPTPPYGSAAGAANTSLTSSPNTTATTTAPQMPIAFGSGVSQSHTTPTATTFHQGALSPAVPGPIPCESPNKGGSNSNRQPQSLQPLYAPPVATTASKPAASRKRRATEDPEGAPNAHNPPKPPLFSSMLSNGPAGPGSTVASGPPDTAPLSFGTKSPAPAAAAKRAYGKHGGTGSGGGGSPVAIPKPPLFGSLFGTNGGDSASSASASGATAAASSAAASAEPSSSKPFAALFGQSGAGGASSSGQLSFGSSAPAAASSPGTGAGLSFGAPSGGGFGGAFGSTNSKADGNVAGSFTFGTGAGTPAFGAGAGFGGGAGVMASVSTPTFGTLGGATTGAPTAAASAPADDEGPEKEPVQKVELKGDDKTEIQFSGKTSFRFMLDGKWGDGTVGALTVRKDKASGKSWLQVNNESKGNILLYAAFIATASATVTEAKGVLVLSLNVFKFPPGKEPNKTVDDGKGGRTALPEKEDNPISAKNVMFKVKADSLAPLLDTLGAVGIKCNKK